MPSSTFVMKPDMRTWVQAAITHHLQGGTAISDTNTCLVSSALAQLLRYWRYEVPGDWGDVLDNVTYGVVAWQIKERAAMSLRDQTVDAFAPSVLDAIKAGDWKTLAELPDQVWGWVEDVTGLSRDEWAMVPEMAAQVLETSMECPRCRLEAPLRDLAQVKETSEPIRLSSTGAVRFTCSRCASGISLDLTQPHLPRSRARRFGITGWQIAGLIAIVLVIYLLFFR